MRFAGCGGFWDLGCVQGGEKKTVRELRKPAVTGFQIW